MNCRHCHQPIHLDAGKWHHTHTGWFVCQLVTTAEPEEQ